MSALAWFAAVLLSLPHFQWQDATVGSEQDARAARTVPVRLAGCDAALRMRVDLGTRTTVLYRDALDRLATEGTCVPVEAATRVTVALAVADGDAVPTPVAIVEEAGDDPAIVGTVGSDYFRDRFLLLDRIGLCDTRCRQAIEDADTACRPRERNGRDVAYGATGSRLRRSSARPRQSACP